MSSKQSQKGTRFEYKVRDLLTEKTGVAWARAPASGAGTLKGDLYCPTTHYYYCFECKSYKDSVVAENLLTAKSNNLYGWWQQTIDQAEAMNRKPALVFKKDRGKFMIMVEDLLDNIAMISLDTPHMDKPAQIYLFEEWLEKKEVKELVL